MSFESPQGIFGNTNATPQCSAVAFALDECGPDSQVGLITIHADYKGNPDYLLGTAPIYDIVPQPEELARFSFIAPVVNIPIAVPVAVRTAGDYGLRFTVADITQFTPLARRQADPLGLSRQPEPQRRTLRQRIDRQTGGLPGTRQHHLHHHSDAPECSQRSAHRQPDHVHG